MTKFRSTKELGGGFVGDINGNGVGQARLNGPRPAKVARRHCGGALGGTVYASNTVSDWMHDGPGKLDGDSFRAGLVKTHLRSGKL